MSGARRRIRARCDHPGTVKRRVDMHRRDPPRHFEIEVMVRDVVDALAIGRAIPARSGLGDSLHRP